jgi:aspartyl-tRNA(Asn)/glutamyl-tRNA(Gln) amidotransferase subunit A
MVTRRLFVGSALAGAWLRGADDELLWKSAEEAAALVRRKSVSPVELTRACLERVEKLNRELNAFVTVMADQAFDAARTLEAEARSGKWRGPLHGIPIGLKDLYDTAGVKTTAASRQWADRVPSQDAIAVRRLKAAGAIVLGKLNMDEFAYNFTGETSSFGTSRNPWNTRRSPGGSSGGSAVAVAAGMCFGALGSDTGGSIRLPAAFCGITGLKPTYGLISAEGVAPLAWSLDHVGPMCRTARDASLLTEALSGKPLREAAVSVRRVRLGIPRAVFYESVDPEVESALNDAAATLARLAGRVQDVTLPALARSRELPDLPETYIRIISAEAYAFHRDILSAHPQRYNPGTRKSIEGGAAVTAADYILARQEMDRLRATSGEMFRDVDLLITPTAAGAAFEFGERRLIYLRNTAPWSLLGLPAVSIPCGFTAAGLPIGMQITGAAGRDDAVLAMASAYQRVTDWHTRRPPLQAG